MTTHIKDLSISIIISKFSIKYFMTLRDLRNNLSKHIKRMTT